MKLELKGVKIAKGLSEETVAFTGGLYADGTKVADLKNSGHGEENRVDWTCDRATIAEVEAHVATLPWPKEWAFMGTKAMDMDACISIMLGEYEQEKRLRGWCRTKTVVLLEGWDEGNYLTYNSKDRAAVEKAIAKKHPGVKYEIVNDRFEGVLTSR